MHSSRRCKKQSSDKLQRSVDLSTSWCVLSEEYLNYDTFSSGGHSIEIVWKRQETRRHESVKSITEKKNNPPQSCRGHFRVSFLLISATVFFPSNKEGEWKSPKKGIIKGGKKNTHVGHLIRYACINLRKGIDSTKEFEKRKPKRS